MVIKIKILEYLATWLFTEFSHGSTNILAGESALLMKIHNLIIWNYGSTPSLYCKIYPNKYKSM